MQALSSVVTRAKEIADPSLARQRRASVAAVNVADIEKIQNQKKKDRWRGAIVKNALIRLPFSDALLRFTESKIYSLVMTIATVFALYGTDVYYLCKPPVGMDDGLYIVVLIVFIMFCLEWLTFSLLKPGYPLGFFFWLDLLACISLIPDMLLLFDIISFNDAGGSLTIARAGRAARAGTRAARIVRVVKLLAVMVKERNRNKKHSELEEELSEAQRPSRIGNKLSDLITRKVIVIVGMMLIISSLLDLIEGNAGVSVQYHVDLLDKTAILPQVTINPNILNNMIAATLIDMELRSDNPDTAYADLISVFRAQYNLSTWPDLNANWNTNPDSCDNSAIRYYRLRGHDKWCFPDNYLNMRKSPREYVLVDSENDSVLVIDDRSYARGQSVINIVQVSIITVVLLFSALLFARDAEILVIAPLDKMAHLVKRLSKNPLATIAEDSEAEQYETDFVESALKKFGRLLQIAFGEAGSAIIGRNLSSDGDPDPMIPGQKMRAIFGFCDIRNFTDCTECLQEEVMVFVNTIANYVHHAVVDNWGAPNKNIGDAFLLVWKLTDNDKRFDSGQQNHPNQLQEQQQQQQQHHNGGGAGGGNEGFEHEVNEEATVYDRALQSFVRIIMETGACPTLRMMTDHPKIQERLPGYRVKMGFGLHVGWAIEGAIGSNLKIDASYLSPNVNMAARLEAATKQFRTSILLSGPFYQGLSPMVQALCRRIDRVTVKGSIQPIDFWTYDVPPSEALSLEEVEADPDQNFFDQFAPATTLSYRREFANAVDLYLSGNFDGAREGLLVCLAQWPGDGPAQALLEVLEGYGFTAPPDWPGYRELVEK